MDYYKKSNVKFNSEVRREIRHAETVRARESSRFKRLSMLRCMDEEEPSFKKTKETASHEVKKPVSRLEILQKWKHEKIIKKELEKKNSIRPFYAGALSLKSTNQGTSKIGKFNQSSGNLSNILKKVSSCNYTQTSKIPNCSRQVSSCNYIQTSKIPNGSKQVSYNASSTSRIPSGSNQLGAVSKTTKNTQAQMKRIPSLNQETTKKPTVYGNNPKTNQAVLRSKIQTSASNSASSLYGLSSTTKEFQSRIAKPASVVPRKIPVQNKLPTSVNQKPNAVLSKNLPSVLPVGVKLPASSCQKLVSGLIKKPGFVSKVDQKKKPPLATLQKQDKKVFLQLAENRNKEAFNLKKIMPEDKNVEPACSPAECKKNTTNFSELFDCDVSIIQPKRSSFAPENFTFQAPAEILDFSFDSSILKKIRELTSRISTSTPSKQPVKEIQDDTEDKKVILELSENKKIETDISIPPKLPTQISVIAEDDEIFLTPHKNIDVELNISFSSKQHAQVFKSTDDKETMQKPYENVNNESKISILKQPDKESKSIEVDNEMIQRSSENVKSKADMSASKEPDQDSKSIKVDNEMMERSSENVKINLSPSEDPVQDSISSPPKKHLEDSHNSTQPSYDNSTAIDKKMLLEDLENIKADFNKDFELSLYKEVEKTKYRETMHSNPFLKRRSILRKSTLKSIDEAEDLLALSPCKNSENKENVFVTPRRSRRISKLIAIDESPSSTPRRSLRLHDKHSKNNQQDSNYKGSVHTNLTNELDKLTLEDFDNMDPNDYLCDFDESPETK